MTQQGVRWAADQVLALAPDAASRKAGSKLGAAGPWSETGYSTTEGAVWGLCKGSGSTPYRTVVDTTGPAYQCGCPSRKFPCKHALGLLLLWAGPDGADGTVPESEPPEWAERWLAGRRERAKQPEAPSSVQRKGSDPEAVRRRAERRAERATAGTTELEQRLTDLLRGGLAGAEQAGYGLWEETARRMVDAQVPGLAARVQELGAVPASGPGWPVRLLEECALLHLLDQAWLHRERLPEPLAATVRTRLGLPTTADGPPIRDRWLVLAQHDAVDPKLTTRRIWLYGAESDRTALLLSFGAAGRAPELALPVGLALDAELSAYPGGRQLRAALGERFAEPEPTPLRPAGLSAAEATAAYGTALRDDPWLDTWPVTLRDVIPVQAASGAGPGTSTSTSGWQLADADGRFALPLSAAAVARPGLWKLAAISGGAPVTVFGECGHGGFTPLTAWPDQPGAEPIPLS
ncbi:SWIM zinc finger family protein [Streptomyces boluensis]|uniref:SWIM zinc finger family protein n=1 Tax=Streptomyces boluensis TaxID=1775135 RepID=A0A964US14_9ACTN|nr:SWIM zinc finger family protein [Streptomyces boluensis]NBE53375.1 SWIM zinc finger family protein [Streptomyces boluensis]